MCCWLFLRSGRCQQCCNHSAVDSLLLTSCCHAACQPVQVLLLQGSLFPQDGHLPHVLPGSHAAGRQQQPYCCKEPKQQHQREEQDIQQWETEKVMQVVFQLSRSPLDPSMPVGCFPCRNFKFSGQCKYCPCVPWLLGSYNARKIRVLENHTCSKGGN